MDIRVQMTGPGGAERLETAPNPPLEPGPGEIRLRHEAIGVNFIDIYHRSGLYPLPAYPAVIGVEGAGRVEAVGEGVATLAPGDRVAYAGAPVGAYASTRQLPAGRAIRLPEDIPARLAAASMLKGLTAHMLLTRTYPVGLGDRLLVHASAGGLGGLVTRWAKRLGAVVIGTAGSEQKAALATAHGADHVIVGRDADIAARVAELTEGRGVDLAIDGTGGQTLRRTLGCVRKFGVVASIGQAAGPIPPLDVEELGPIRTLSLTRPSVMAYSAEPEAYAAGAAALLDAMREGVAAEIGAELPLAEAAEAHHQLESGASRGSLLLIP